MCRLPVRPCSEADVAVWVPAPDVRVRLLLPPWLPSCGCACSHVAPGSTACTIALSCLCDRLLALSAPSARRAGHAIGAWCVLDTAGARHVMGA